MPSETYTFILGAGGLAKELRYYFSYFLHDHNTILISPENQHEYNPTDKDYTIMGVGNCTVKEKMLAEIKGKVLPFLNFGGHCLSSDVGRGTILAPGCVVAPNTSIGKHVLINYNATVGHDTKIGDLSIISPNASISGNCKLGRGVYVGAGANIKESVTIADGVIVGMGAVVLEDIIIPNTIVIGIPAKPKNGLVK